MNKVYLVKCSASDAQSTMLDKLKSKGLDVIQTSDGLCVKGSITADELGKLTDAAQATLVTDLLSEERNQLSADIKSFIES